MTNDESLSVRARPLSLRAVHKLATTDPLYDLCLQRELQMANARTRIELGAAGVCMAEEPKSKPCIADPKGMEKLKDTEAEDGEMSTYRNLAMATVLCAASGCASDGPKSPGREYETAAHVRYGSSIDRRHVPPTVKNDKLIMPFFDHSFSASCYETLACRVLYDNSYVVNEDKPSGSLTPAIRKNLGGSWAILDFPSKAHVAWTSKDGETHEEEINLEEIFKSRLVLYSPELNVNDVNLAVSYIPPEIILVVDGRSLHVYMKAMIPLIRPMDPGNRHTNFRNDLVVAYTKNF